MDHVANLKADEDRWQSLYKIGAVAALVSLLLIPLSMVAFFIWPPFPDDILAVIQEDRLAGLMSLDVPYLLASAFSIPFFLVLYVTLKKVDQSWAVIARILFKLGWRVSGEHGSPRK